VYTADRAQKQYSDLHYSDLPSGRGRRENGPASSSVQFYEDDSLFLDSLSEFVGAALGAGGACVIVATNAHRAGLIERLKSNGVDLSYTTAVHRFVALDAVDVLGRFMVGGHPDEERFNAAIEPELLRARKALRGSSTSVVAFGEMVSILWQEGKYEAAIEVEKLWDRVAQRHAFSLRCAYPIGLFTDQAQYELFRQVCSNRTRMVSGESHSFLDGEGDRHRMISSLQQKAWTMQAVMKGREEEILNLKRVEKKLQRSQEFAKGLVECSADCVKILDLNGRLEYMSPTGLRAFEVGDAEQLRGRLWSELWVVDDRSRAEAAVAAAVAGEVGTFVGEYMAPSGKRAWWDVRIAPCLDAEGRLDQLVAIGRDVTELRLAQQAAIEAEKHATAGRMAATIAHEINNPLEAVTNFIYLAQTSKDLPQEAREHLDAADRELSRAAQITRQTLGFYRGGTRQKWISMPELIQDILNICGAKLRNKQLATFVSIDPDIAVYGKDGELRQALLNLTANAVDASHTGGKLWFRAHRAHNWKSGGEQGIRITLADNGVGMAPEVQGRIFVPFFTTKTGTGTGIGLWVTKCLVEQQGGHMRFRSRQGEKSGTVMTLFLPVRRNTSADHAEVA
jgi:PAS domain S-box-containing protein